MAKQFYKFLPLHTEVCKYLVWPEIGDNFSQQSTKKASAQVFAMSNQLSSSQLSSSSKPSQRPTTREHSLPMSDKEVIILSDCEDDGAAPPPKRGKQVILESITIERLESSNMEVRAKALSVLKELEPAVIGQHVGAVVASLEASCSFVRGRALQALCQLEPKLLAQYVDVVVAAIEDSDEWVQFWALRALTKLEPATLLPHVSAVFAKLAHFDEYEHEEVPTTAIHVLLRLLPPSILRDFDLEDDLIFVRNCDDLPFEDFEVLVMFRIRPLCQRLLELRPQIMGRLG